MQTVVCAKAAPTLEVLMSPAAPQVQVFLVHVVHAQLHLACQLLLLPLQQSMSTQFSAKDITGLEADMGA